MAKVKFYMDSGANIKSAKESKWLDTAEDLGLYDGEWEKMDDNEKYMFAEEWAWQNGLSIGYEEKS